jgi:hypothetical protein
MRSFAALLATLVFMAACVEAVLVPPPGGNGGAGGSGAATSTGAGGVGGSGGGGGESCGCEELDVLLAIDNTTSNDFLSQLIPAFAQLAGKASTLPERACSFHFGVVTSTPQLNNPDMPVNCQVFGALSSVRSDTTPCALANGKFATEEDNLLDVVPCLAETGRQSANGTERLMDAVFTALDDPTLNGPGGCNEGFFRPNAPLLLIVVSDIDDNGSANDPADWFDRLQGLDNSGVADITALGIFPNRATNGCDSGDGVQFAPRLHEFFDPFEPAKRATFDLCTANTMSTQIGAAIDAGADILCPLTP